MCCFHRMWLLGAFVVGVVKESGAALAIYSSGQPCGTRIARAPCATLACLGGWLHIGCFADAQCLLTALGRSRAARVVERASFESRCPQSPPTRWRLGAALLRRLRLLRVACAARNTAASATPRHEAGRAPVPLRRAALTLTTVPAGRPRASASRSRSAYADDHLRAGSPKSIMSAAVDGLRLRV